MHKCMSDPWVYDDMLSDIASGKRFAFVRYSDGDWNCFFNRVGRVVNEHTYMPDLGVALRESLKPEPGYHVGIMTSLLTPGRWWASEHVIKFVAEHPEIPFCSSMILHCASQYGTMGRYFEAIKGRRLVVVGNSDMAKMVPWLESFEHIIIPEQECWLDRDRIEPQIIDAAQEPGIVMFSCSMPSKVWIRRTWEAGGKASLVDIGAVFDPYIGRMSREYMREGRHILAEKLYG